MAIYLVFILLKLFAKLIEPLKGGGEARAGEEHNEEITNGAEYQNFVVTAESDLQYGFKPHNDAHTYDQLEYLYQKRCLDLGFDKLEIQDISNHNAAHRAEQGCAGMLCGVDICKLIRRERGGSGKAKCGDKEYYGDTQENAEDDERSHGFILCVLEKRVNGKGQRNSEHEGNTHVKGSMYAEIHS